MIVGYARVSTLGQSTRVQIDELRAAGCDKVVSETGSAKSLTHRRLRVLLQDLQPGDTLIVTRLDRLARSSRDLLHVLGQLGDKGVAFRSLRDHWADTSSAHGRLLVTVLAGMAEFERELLLARTSEGRAAAKARGQAFGRPGVLTPHQIQWVALQRREGVSCRHLSQLLNVHYSTIARIKPAADDAPDSDWKPGDPETEDNAPPAAAVNGARVRRSARAPRVKP